MSQFLEKLGTKKFVKVLANSKKIDLKESLLNYLKSELEILEKRKNLDLELMGKGKNSRKEIRMWGEVDKDGEFRLTFLGNKKKLYLSKENCINGVDFKFSGDREDVIEFIKQFIQDLEDGGELNVFYRKSSKKGSEDYNNIIEYKG